MVWILQIEHRHQLHAVPATTTMIVQCDNCQRSVLLDESTLPEHGHEIRCSACNHVFSAYKPSSLTDGEIDTHGAEEITGPNAEIGMSNERCHTPKEPHQDSLDSSPERTATDDGKETKVSILDMTSPRVQPKTGSGYLQIQHTGIAERVNLARSGNKELRRILIRDPSRAVQVAVLGNPRITEGEIEQIASSKRVDDEVIRIIINNREWVRSYGVKAALVKNPRTPLRASLGFLPHMRDKELNHLANSKNVPNVIAVAAKKLYLKRRGQKQGR